MKTAVLRSDHFETVFFCVPLQISELDFQDSLMTIGMSADVTKEMLQVRH